MEYCVLVNDDLSEVPLSEIDLSKTKSAFNKTRSTLKKNNITSISNLPAYVFPGIVPSSLDEKRYGPFLLNDFGVLEKANTELKKFGFHLEGPFSEKERAMHYWSSGQRD